MSDWRYATLLIFYNLLLLILSISYTDVIQTDINQQVRSLTNEIMNNDSVVNVTFNYGSSTITSESQGISFLTALKITFTEEVPFLVTLFFAVVPNTLLGFLLYRSVRHG